MTGFRAGTDRKRKMIAAALLSALVLIVYSQCGGFELVTYDDTSYVTGNERVMEGLSVDNVGWAFSTFQLSNYHPLTVTSHMLDTSLFGDSAGARHLVNVFFHLLNVLLLFFFLVKATSERAEGGLIPAFFAAAFFAVHPVHVESVAWVSERKDVLSTFFWLAAMHCWLVWVKEKNMSGYALTFFFTGLGILAKPMVVTLPAALLLLDIWPLNRVDLKHKPVSRLIKLAVEKWPLFALSVLSSVLTIMAQKGGGAMQTIESFPLSLRASNALVSWGAYLGDLVAPANLAVFYPYPHEIPLWKPVLSALFILAVSIVCIRFIKKVPFIAVGWFWYLGTLVPVIGLVQVGDQAMADRYAYIPFIGLYMAISFGIACLVKEGRVPAKAAIAVGSIIVVVLLACSYTQAGYWRNSETLYLRALDVTENNHHMHYNYGNLLERKKESGKAAENFRAAIKADPSHYKAMTNLANILAQRGELMSAMELYQRALQIKPDYATAYANRGIAYHRQGKLDLALADYRRALELNPLLADSLVNIGILYYMRGDTSAAKESLRKALEIDPDNKLARKNLNMIP
ncbi:tetratricopeptide repeat protein [Maridesulfovibrio hydrothermalis]|uniref:Tetratricopeptide TPR_2 repeat protein n=1 Tax=Maridesulfovibrio hydrothermalis AM13 = DSM 14728 TaxID=1121451 RepID=L0RBJ1_9BACT|nr:tetratricopeptide repeat protein [Maridesulfovibrio hydrothermalis]CCO23550.1 Tetratricopeptide TPR_2 repeat protein [Maridesulfovibrio hydrothermalis AM13 = DSM 14728]